MAVEMINARISGRLCRIPSIVVGEQRVAVVGGFLKIASIYDGDWLAEDPMNSPEEFLRAIKAEGIQADLFMFSQRLPETTPLYDYPFEMENLAVVSLNSYAQWWDGLPQESRKNVRRAARKGISVKVNPLDSRFIEGVRDIYNESPYRQGRRFPHYGKSVEELKEDLSSFLDRSEFIAAHLGDELVGFIKVVHMQKVSSLLHIISKLQHEDKRPTNALLAKTVELCAEKKQRFFVYGNYTYGRKENSSLTEFKRRNGFEKVLIPKYTVPLTGKGAMAVRFGLHRGAVGLLPGCCIDLALKWRAALYRWQAGRARRTIQQVEQPPFADAA